MWLTNCLENGDREPSTRGRWGGCALPELLDLLKLTGELVGKGLLEGL